MTRKLVFLLLALLLTANLAAAAPQPASLACADEPKDRGFPRFARLMHDPQWMEWPSRMGDPDWPNGFYLNWYPETVQLFTSPHSGEGQTPYSKEWLEYLRALQPNDEAAVWLTRVAAGLFNRGNEFIPILDLEQLKDEPVAVGISSGGNVVKILETKNGSARIDTIYFHSDPPDPAVLNYKTKPWLVTKFTSVSRDGELGNAGGIDVYFPILSNQRKGYWVELRRVEMFPNTPYCAVTNSSRAVLTEPRTGAQVATIAAGQPITIREYLPQGSNVWGRIDRGWILIEYLSDGMPVYPTSWTMQTRPPILFP